MTIRLRLYDARARVIWTLRSGGAGASRSWRWLSIHGQPPDWRAVFERALRLLALQGRAEPQGFAFGTGGRITWQVRRRWTVITLELVGVSPAKRKIVAAALRKAARYGEPS